MDEPIVQHAHWLPDMADVVRIDDPAIVQALAVRKACHEAGLLDEHGNLRKIVGTLPVTADGVVVMPGQRVWHPGAKEGDSVLDQDAGDVAWTEDGEECEGRFTVLVSDDWGTHNLLMEFPIEECYSTSSAAERAAKERSDGH